MIPQTMLKAVKRVVQAGFMFWGYEVSRHRRKGEWFPADVSAQEREILQAIHPFTMTSVERQISLIRAVRHIVQHDIPGCLVECGVWRGGSAMAMALTLKQERKNRDIYLYDTFAGMTPPTDQDRLLAGGATAASLLANPETAWFACIADIEDVRRNVASTGYPNVKYITGPVEQTLPSQSPEESIALLRLDTDWYESTRHELMELYPCVSPNGVLIVDDYGVWSGAKQAVDEYFAGSATFLHRIDETGRLVIKSAA